MFASLLMYLEPFTTKYGTQHCLIKTIHDVLKRINLPSNIISMVHLLNWGIEIRKDWQLRNSLNQLGDSHNDTIRNLQGIIESFHLQVYILFIHICIFHTNMYFSY